MTKKQQEEKPNLVVLAQRTALDAVKIEDVPNILGCDQNSIPSGFYSLVSHYKWKYSYQWLRK